MQTETFELEGEDGEMHSYKVDLHPGSKGARLAIKLYSLAGEPIGELIQTYMKVENIDLDSENGAQRLLSEVDFSDVAKHVRAALTKLDTDELIDDVFCYTRRDGQDLSKRTYFDQAYRGNYGELFRAAWKIVQANGFLSSFATFMGG